ncbi:hypothetical protein BC828DRAFT_394497 [Blastocladiella britannica]|nr:hypothetical protein BC828DRAFT_394497 [Blastocladiella britannica]
MPQFLPAAASAKKDLHNSARLLLDLVVSHSTPPPHFIQLLVRRVALLQLALLDPWLPHHLAHSLLPPNLVAVLELEMAAAVHERKDAELRSRLAQLAADTHALYSGSNDDDTRKRQIMGARIADHVSAIAHLILWADSHPDPLLAECATPPPLLAMWNAHF